MWQCNVDVATGLEASDLCKKKIRHAQTQTQRGGTFLFTALLFLFPLLSLCQTTLPAHSLQTARGLTPPPVPTATTNAEYENEDYFAQHGPLLRAAWKEFGMADPTLNTLPPRFIEPPLLKCINIARENPSVETERALRTLFTEIVPGVQSGRILTPEAIAKIRIELDRIGVSGIPTRRPNGMNRFGIIPDANVEGGVTNGLHHLIRELVKEYLVPLMSTLFPADIGAGDVDDYFAFTIQYNVSNGDRSLNEHRDASVATLNLNLNSVHEFETLNGSSLYFVDQEHNTRRTVALAPGGALLHRGSLRHAANPLVGSGQRQNLIVWLFGKDGYVRDAVYGVKDQLTAMERWAGGTGKSVGSFTDL